AEQLPQHVLALLRTEADAIVAFLRRRIGLLRRSLGLALRRAHVTQSDVLRWSQGPMGQGAEMSEKPGPVAVERVQLGVRMEKRIVKVLKGLAEYSNLTLGQLLEKVVLHSFEPEPGQEGEWCASPYSKKTL